MPNAKDSSNPSIADLVKDNYVFAAVLHYFGISFFQYKEKSLEDVCRKFRVKAAQVMAELEKWAGQKEPSSEELYLHPIEVLVEYLRKKHYDFVCQQLPFLSNMIAGIRVEGKYKELLADMGLMFPLFVDDFVHHIHEEEDTLFKRIALLHHLEEGDYNLVDALRFLEAKSITHLAHAHEVHDDEMEGIRKLTNDYQLEANAPMELKVLYYHLQNFEAELAVHAKIENDLLFPKALELEKEVRRKVQIKIQSN
ncbi:hemerythrin HHE cation-binding protein [Litoribacter ruber]|uniref:hemerythrin HHE cation-binding protein n=1 Tax=Litoribacter ruber TaxID=702568 RepID=UPI001BD9768D|nr:hemerythrin HHE cation-binding protein [Litoribacter ruber]MBT0811075.1 hemerythrin HHE cation-binding protein [Litoribacter ruber]